jgi:phosphatidylserine/phosphatidylglycerophosphate/cardiolipin synthase-like enzyme
VTKLRFDQRHDFIGSPERRFCFVNSVYRYDRSSKLQSYDTGALAKALIVRFFMASQEVTNAWREEVRSHTKENELDDPNYFALNPDSLMTTSTPSTFHIGTGEQILSNVVSKCTSTSYELLIVTCFWAKSASQEIIASLLLRLSEKGISQKHKIQVRICFSSSSILQKLSQTSSLDGKFYPPSSWTSLGLPSPDRLEGLEMIIKSVFVLPFSVMHPKFVLMDRKVVFMPSCNVSWENWFEGCVELEGDITKSLFDFWSSFWSRGCASLPEIPKEIQETSDNAKDKEVQTILLPSPHHLNPRFQPFTTSNPPPTPLNIFILQLFRQAKQDIFIQTPNLTSQPVINAIFSALERGINIHLITSTNLMILEQLATAGTITEYEVWKLIRRYRTVVQNYNKSFNTSDLENLIEQPGILRIGYYHSREGENGSEEPIKSHLKCMIMDGEVTVLGSGNMDRASWYTSQELGVALFSGEFAGYVRGVIDEGLKERVRYVC